MNHLMDYGGGSDSEDEELIGPPIPESVKTKVAEEAERDREKNSSSIVDVDGQINSLKLEARPDKIIEDEGKDEQFIGPPIPQSFNKKQGNKDSSDGSSTSQKVSKKQIQNDNDDFIGPPAPKNLTAEEEEEDDDSDSFIGPPVPADYDEGKGADSEEDSESSEEGEDEDYDKSSVIPIKSSVAIAHGSKAVVALAVDPAGARLASGSVDYDVRFWDFAGMDNSLQSFRTLTPCGNNPIKALNYSATGDAILVISGMSQAKVLDRDGHEVIECVKGDQYVTDMARTKGHTAPLTGGNWHPRIKEEFLTSSEDGTCRLWDVKNHLNHKSVIKCRAQNGLRTTPTSCCFNRDGNLIACVCLDGSIQIWDKRRKFVNAALTLRNAHQNGSETGGLAFSYGGNLIATRSCDDTLKLWDMKAFKKPIFEIDNLFSRYLNTNCTFSPNDGLIVTGHSLKKGETQGKMLFYDVKTSRKLTEEVVGNSHVIQTLWHPRLQQIFVGCGDGSVKAYFNQETSSGGRGALLCATKTRKKRKQVEVVAAQQIITPHALPMFRQEKPKSLRKKMEKERLDPVKSRRPDLPIKSGQGGRVATSGSTLSSYVIRNLGLSKRVEDDQDPREAILRYAKEAAENPYWISPAYVSTQPNTIFQTDEGEEILEELPSKKPRV